MGHDPEQYPHEGVDEKELYIRDMDMLNYYINHDKWSWWKYFDIIDAHRFVDDFCHEIDVDHDWELNQSGAGAYACQNQVNGVLRIATIAEANTYTEFTMHNEGFKLVDCYPLYCEARLRISSVTESVFWFGLTRGNSWIVHPDDYAVFMSPSGHPSIEFATAVNGGVTYVDSGEDYVAMTWFRIGFHWDGDGTIRWFVITDGNPPQVIAAQGNHTADIPQDEELSLGFGIQTDDSTLKYMDIDYVKCVQKRVIE